jgi:ABC-type multidrug transport system ATPase subunit
MTFELLLRNMSLKASGHAPASRLRLRNISLRCQSGERIGLIGNNGAGKSSLARVLCGLERPTTGKRERRPGHTRVMLILQRPEEHFLAKTVSEEIAGYAPQQPGSEEIDDWLRAVGLDTHFADSAPRALSSGQQRALSLACGLATQPGLLILDEPMAGLDAPSREQVMQSLKTLSQSAEMALCVISHHPDDLLGWAERLWALEDGALIYDGAFGSIPIGVLDRCLDKDASSLFYALRRLEETGYPLDPAVYQHRTAETIAQLIEEGGPR